MKKILVFGGTSEGRMIAYTLSENKIMVHLCVATDYGQQIIEENEFLAVHKGRLNVEEMKKLCLQNCFNLIIDATHPFATEVSGNIKKCSEDCSINLLRFERKVSVVEKANVIYADDIKHCIELIEKTEGKILLTTGSKDLNQFCKNEDLRKWLVVRVLPGIESLKLCYENGLEGSQIIAMQGPFSVKMNEIQIADYDISVLVTKESGKAGGLDSKIIASMNKNICCIVIKNPSLKFNGNSNVQNYFSFSSFDSLYEEISRQLEIKILSKCSISVSLVGTGMGNEKLLTADAIETIKNADIIFGSQRLIENFGFGKEKLPYYLAKDIIPEIEKIKRECSEKKNICVLFSGDSGFYSGANSLRKKLEELEDIDIKLLPGISSLSYLASRIGQNYDDICIISMHGISEKLWLPKLKSALEKRKKIFMLTSGIDDVAKASKEVLAFNRLCNSANYKIAAGYRLSYEDEKITVVENEEELNHLKEGLYSLFISEEF